MGSYHGGFLVTCAKKIVKATLLLKDGSLFYGTNDCRTPQTVCPRLPGEGYSKCGTVCHQPFHAEIDALQQAIMKGHDVEGGHMIVFYDKVCADCAVEMAKYHVTWETRV